MREIVTLQLGQLSNYVATHFWNTQESYFTYSAADESLINHDVHWRPGVGSDGSDTYLPRTIIYDFKASFGTLRKLNALYDPEPDLSLDNSNAFSLWGDKPVLHKQDPIQASAYQQSLDTGSAPPQLTKSTVRYWSDFSRVYYHPKSLVQLHDSELNSAIRPFDRYSTGMELFETLDKEHGLVDGDFRSFAEECDMMQGIQVLSSLEDAWGGFSAQYLEALRDEYPKSCIWLWGLENPTKDLSRAQRHARLINMAQGIADISSTATIVAPIGIPEGALPSATSIDAGSPWHVSALYATAIEAATTPSRLIQRTDGISTSLWDMSQKINSDGNRPLAALRMRVGSAACSSSLNKDTIELFRLGQIASGRRRLRLGRSLGTIISSRGITATDRVEKTDASAQKRWLSDDGSLTRFSISLKFPLLDSFPKIYEPYHGDDGLDVQTLMSTDTTMSQNLKILKTRTIRSIDLNERESLANRLTEMADAYQDDWDSGSDEDDDEI